MKCRQITTQTEADHAHGPLLTEEIEGSNTRMCIDASIRSDRGPLAARLAAFPRTTDECSEGTPDNKLEGRVS